MTKRAPTNSDKNSDTSQSAQRSLSLAAVEAAGDSESGQKVNLDDKADGNKMEINPETENEPNLNSEGVAKTRKRSRKQDVDTNEEQKINETAGQPSSNAQAPAASSSKMGSNARRLRARNTT